MNPLVSIIIPTFNREKELKRAINSVVSQTYSNWEICVIDNFSLDNTIELIESYDDLRIKLFMIENNGIIAASRNLGIKNATGKYLAFLDSDDWWSRNKLEYSVIALNKGANVIYHDLNIVSRENQNFFLKRAKTRKLKAPIFDDLIINGNALITSSVVLKKEIMIQIGGFSEDKNLVAIEDYDAWLRIAKVYGNFEKLSKTLGYYWLGGGNTSNPRRTISVLTALEERYHSDLLKLRLVDKIYWFNYNKGRAFYKLSMKKEATKSFNLTLSQYPNLNIKVKCLYMILIINSMNFINKFNKKKC